MKSRIAKRLFLAGAALLLVAGCASPSFQLIDESGRVHQGRIGRVNPLVEAEINGKTYKGFYTLGTKTLDFNMTQQPGAKAGATETAGGARFAGNTGSATLTSANGDVLQCSFGYGGTRSYNRASGVCVDEDGKQYRLIKQ